MSTEVSSKRSRAIRRPGWLSSAVSHKSADDAAPFIDHLAELRRRLIIIVAALVAVFVAWYIQRDLLFEILARPLDDRWPLQTLGVTEPFFTSLTVAAQAAFVCITPLIAWHVWRFIRPAIELEARRMIAVLLIVAPGLFTAGVAFGYFFILGPAVRFLLGLSPESFEVVVRANDYYSFVSMTLVAIGTAFCFPLVLMGAARIGVISSELLAKNRRFAVLGIALLAAMLPTADPVSLVLEIVPLLGLYELSIIAIRIQEKRWQKVSA